MQASLNFRHLSNMVLMKDMRKNRATMVQNFAFRRRALFKPL